MTRNRRFLLVRRPQGEPQQDDFQLVEAPLPEAGEGEFLVRNLYVSLDPAMRGWLDDKVSYQPPVPLGEVVRAATVGKVVRSRNPAYPEGVYVAGLLGIQEFALVPAGNSAARIVAGDVPLTLHLSLLGGPGITAYFGMTDVGRPVAGETVLVSAAAGAVGSIAGQIAKIKGCRAVGIAGGAEKCTRLLKRYGYDAAVDYRGKTLDTLTSAIAEAAPNGVDLIYENVGGEILDAGLRNLNRNGRIALCGLISDYNRGASAYGTREIWQLIVKRATMRGFLLSGYADRIAEAVKQLREWSEAGLLKVDEHIETGIEQALPAFLRLFRGTNHGKMILKLD